MNKALPTLVIISDTAYYPIFLRQSLSDTYHIYPLSASDFTMNQALGLSIDVIIIDDRSFGDEIFTLCREFRKRIHFHNLPILIITSKLRKAYIDRLIKAGANDFIREPLEKEDLLDKLQDVEKYRQIQGKLVGIHDTLAPSKGLGSSLKNRFLLDRAAMTPIIKTINEGSPVCVIAIFIDQGDEIPPVLHEAINSFFKSQLRKGDLLYPLGHSNYLILLNQTSIRGAHLIAENMKEAISLNEFIDEDRPIKITLSIGIAGQKRPPYANINEMIIDAKNALMKAKEVGNQIILHHN